MIEEYIKKRKRYKEEEIVMFEKVFKFIIIKEILKEKFVEYVE